MGEPGRSRRVARLGPVLVVPVLLVASCAGGAPRSASPAGVPASPAAFATSVATSGPTPRLSSGVVVATTSAGSRTPAADLAAITTLIDAINATAGGTVAAQRTVLQRRVVPAEADWQRECPAAHNTLRLDPVYDDLRRSPDDLAATASTPASASTPVTAATTPPTATAYLLPVLITIYTGDRITGTDLTTLRLFVTEGTALIGHLCVS